MNDLETSLHEVFRERINGATPVGLRSDVLAIPDSPSRPRGWRSAVERWRLHPALGATAFLVAGVFVALVGGFLLSAAAPGPSVEDRMASGATPSRSDSPTAGPDNPPKAPSSPSPRPGTATPPPCLPAWDPPDRSISWETPSASLHADSIELRFGECFFTGIGTIERLTSDPGNPRYRSLEVRFLERGAMGGMYIYFEADETHWWVRDIASSAGILAVDPSAPDSFADEEGRLFRTPRGEAFQGDIRLLTLTEDESSSVEGELIIDGLRLTAFAPGTGPAHLPDCKNVPQPKRADMRRRLTKLGLTSMKPGEVESLLRGRGLCFTFRYDYRFPPDTEEGGYTERWCTAPPRGKVGYFGFLPSGELIVGVGDRKSRERREQPPEGWNCPSDAVDGAADLVEPMESP